MSTQYVLVHQPPNEDNPTYFGPFDSLAEVSTFAGRYQLDHEEWHVTTLVNPMSPEPNSCTDYQWSAEDVIGPCARCGRKPWDHTTYEGMPWPTMQIRTWQVAGIITPERAVELQSVTA